MEVEEDSALKGKIELEEQEDFVYHYRSKSSSPGSPDYVETEESSSDDDCDSYNTIGGDESGDITAHGGVGLGSSGSNGGTGDVGGPSYLRPRSTRTRRRPTRLWS